MSVCIHIKGTLIYESFCHILRSDIVRLGQARALPVNCLLHIRSQLKLIGKHEAGAVTL